MSRKINIPIKRLFKYTIAAFLFVLLFTIMCNLLVIRQTKNMQYDTANSVPENNVGLVLGTSRYMADGSVNLFFKYRIDAAVELFRAGKIKHILVSGDNSTIHYNEAEYMRRALVKHGIPDKSITLDYAGFRTLDSVIRCKKVFGQNKFTIISQQFHNQRALFICKHYNIDAVGFNAKDVPAKLSTKTMLREVLAKTKAVIDVFFINEQPKFLGEPITIPA